MNTTQNEQSTPTGQTVALTDEHVMETRVDRRTLGGVLGISITVCLTGAAFVASATLADSDTSSHAPAASVDRSGIAAWADANGLTGLSPASLALAPDRVAAVDRSGIAAWADANGLTGLSPAGLSRIED